MRRFAVAVAAMLMMGTSPLYAQDALFVVTASSVYIHKAPSTGSPVLGKAPRGQSFKVVRELGSWVSVSWPEGDNGVAYLHVTWGTMSRGGVQAPPEESVNRTPVAVEELFKSRWRSVLILQHQLFVALHECRVFSQAS